MAEKNLCIDKEKCIHCGLCIKDCIAYSLEFDENNVPKFAQGGEDRCIQCQHCLSVCPVGAVSILGKNPENSEPLYAQNPDMILNLIKSRRSFRHYKQENLSPEIIQKLKDMLNWTPTGCNFHKLHFAFVEDKAVMDKIRDYVNTKIINIIKKVPYHKAAKKFAHYLDAMVAGEDVIFRKAPHMVVVSVPLNAPCVSEDPVIALSYFELYAQSLGVATCWCGFAQLCMQLFPELGIQMNILEGYKPAYVMLFGPADIKYSRTTQPEPFEFYTVDKFEPQKTDFLKRVKYYLGGMFR